MINKRKRTKKQNTGRSNTSNSYGNEIRGRGHAQGIVHVYDEYESLSNCNSHSSSNDSGSCDSSSDD